MSTENKSTIQTQDSHQCNSNEIEKIAETIPSGVTSISSPCEPTELNKSNQIDSQLNPNQNDIKKQDTYLQNNTLSNEINNSQEKLNKLSIQNILDNHLKETKFIADYILKNWDSQIGLPFVIDDNISIAEQIGPLKCGQYNEANAPLIIRVRKTKNPDNENKNLDIKNDKIAIDYGPSTKGDILNNGLHVYFDKHTKTVTIKGAPLKPGDYEYKFLFITDFKFDHDKLVVHSGCLKITINADPKLLWKEIEPADDVYKKTHTDNRQITKDNIIVAGASRRGRSHAHNGSFRDDDFELAYLEEFGFWIIAVADGAGSAKLSRRGSQIACQTVVSQIKEKIQATGVEKINTILKEAVHKKDEALCKKFLQFLVSSAYVAFTKINEESKATGNHTKDFSTTLNLTLAKKFDETWFLGTFSIGDGGVACIDNSGNPINLSEYDEGEFAGQTRFLTTTEIWSSKEEQEKRLRCAFIDNLKYIFAFTDGITDPFFPTMNDFRNSEKWKEFIEQLEKETGLSTKPDNLDLRLLEWLNFWSVGNHDDRTIVIFVA